MKIYIEYENKTFWQVFNLFRTISRQNVKSMPKLNETGFMIRLNMVFDLIILPTT